jgi:hypothetical protein
VNINEQIRSLRKTQVDPELLDMLGAYDFEQSIEMTEKEPDLEEEFGNLTRTVVPRLTKDDIAAMTGLSIGEIKQLEKNQRPKRKLKEFLDLAKRDALPIELQKSFQYMEKSFGRTGSLTESMTEAVDLFQEHFSHDELSLLQKCIKALDLSAFLKILSCGMQKAAFAA